MAPNPAIYCKPFTSVIELQTFLVGGVIGSQPLYGRVPGFHGKTLVFTEPFAHPPATKTVTFSAPTGYINMQAIKLQIEAIVPNVVVSWREGRIVMVEAVANKGVAITSAGTANPLLGFGPHNQVGHVFVWHTAAGTHKVLQTVQLDDRLVLVTAEE